MRVIENRLDRGGNGRFPGVGGQRVLNRSFARAPTKVQTSHSGRDHVDLLARILTDITDPQIACGAIERATPRVAQAEGPNLIPQGETPEVRIAVGDCIRIAVIDIDPEDLAQ